MAPMTELVTCYLLMMLMRNRLTTHGFYLDWRATLEEPVTYHDILPQRRTISEPDSMSMGSHADETAHASECPIRDSPGMT